jgi:outer membrane protein assembly factor BamB
MKALSALLLTVAVAASAAVAGARTSEDAAPSTGALMGAWAGTLTHAGETQPFALELEPAGEGKVLVKATLPAIHVAHQPFGAMPLVIEGSEVRFGPFRFVYDTAARTLSGTMPKELVPVYDVPMTLRRVEVVETTPREEIGAPVVAPHWTYAAGAPLWAGASFAAGYVYAGGEDGVLHALDAATGEKRWTFAAGGPIRARARVAGEDVYLPADDGFVYKLSARTGEQRWRVQVVSQKIERLPFDNPKSRYDRFGSEVTVAGGRLYLGTHDGRVVALDPARGETLWEFRTGDAVLATPAVDSGRVYAGSFDGHVYALDAASGALLWKHDTRGPVVSTPAAAGGRLVVGSRSYDLLGLETASGAVAWQRYVWFSWIESSAAIRNGTAYVGSSDAAVVGAYAVASGRRLWATDVHGWAWGQPAVTADRVYMTTSAQKGYLVGHRGGLVALDRASGRPVWQYVAAEPEDTKTYGFPGTAAVGGGRVYVTGLDGLVYAFDE